MTGIQGTPNSVVSASIVDTTIVNADISTSAAIAPSKIAVITSETNTTPVAGANDTVVGTANRYYSFFTLPSTASFYIITGIEWLNGTVVNGAVMGIVEQVNANLPTVAGTNLLAFINTAATQTGVSAIQRASQITSHLIPGGTICGASIVSSSATGRFGTTTVASGNRLKAVTIANDPPNANAAAWAAGTEEPYIKVYYKGVL